MKDSTWRFAENQWDYVGGGLQNGNVNGSTNDNIAGPFIDLFACATWLGHKKYPPTSNLSAAETPNSFEDYPATISTLWRTLSGAEWKYIINRRGVGKYVQATVNDVYGLILFPDEWDESTFFDSYAFSVEEWKSLEEEGAVFLPAAGFRYEKTVSNVGSYGYYWSSTQDYFVFGQSLKVEATAWIVQSYSVRLVRDL